MIPTFVLVGRPNVGKSTLFNRLVGYRKAIVYDRPGVTRDRHQANAKIRGHEISLIDTGGYAFEPKQDLDQEMVKQIHKGLDQASALLWVVDAKDGLSPEDERLSKVLRKTNKPIVLVLNKVDPGSKNANRWEFEKLGFSHLVNVSAEHGLGMGDLEDVMLSFVGESAEPESTEETNDAISIAIVGRPNVGKSSLINALVHDARLAVSENAGTTRDAIDIKLEKDGKKYIFLDTAGLRYKRKVTDDVEYFSVKRAMEAIDRADVVMLIVSAEDGLTTQEEKIAAQVIKRNKPMSIFVNKWDLKNKGDEVKKEFREDLYYKAPFLHFVDVFFMSALQETGIEKVFVQAKHLYQKINQAFDEDELIHAYKTISNYHHQVGKQGHFLELKRLTAHLRTKQSPVFRLKCNKPKLVTDAYKKYWINALTDFFSMRGVPIDVKFRQK